jgi:hypothetical protein
MMLGLLSRYFSHLQWYEEHSEFLLNPLYIAGDSYSGLIVPPLTFRIARGKLPCSLKILGNSYKFCKLYFIAYLCKVCKINVNNNLSTQMVDLSVQPSMYFFT